MYAVIKTGGKQQKVRAGDVIEVEKLVHEGETVTFQPLLVVDDDGTTHVGSEVAKATVTAKPLEERKGEKIRIFKYRPKTGYAQRQGHRQIRTVLEIEGVALTGGSAAKKSTAKPAAKSAAKPAAKKSAAKKFTAKKPAAKAATSTAKKSAAKKTTAKKSTAKASTAKRSTAAKKDAPDAGSGE